MRVAITGSTGLIGTAVAPVLRAAGHEVVPIVRRDAGSGDVLWDPGRGVLDPDDLAGLDAVLNLAGKPLAPARWTEKHKRECFESRVRGTALLAETLAAMGEAGPGILLNASAVGLYGPDLGGETVTEATPAGSGYLADLTAAWERAAEPAATAGARVVLLRTGLVLSGDGGLLGPLLPLFRLGLGARLGSGDQFWPWISITDEVEAIRFLLEHDGCSGAFNLVGPAPATNREVTEALGRALGRPTFLAVPRFAPRLVLGREATDEAVFSGQKAVPEALLEAGYEFRHPTVVEAVQAVVGGRRSA